MHACALEDVSACEHAPPWLRVSRQAAAEAAAAAQVTALQGKAEAHAAEAIGFRAQADRLAGELARARHAASPSPHVHPAVLDKPKRCACIVQS